jgi:integrase/recombinase XerD
MSAVTGMAVQAAAFMQRAGYSPGSMGSYRRIWGQFGEYCAVSGVQEPDRETAAQWQSPETVETPVDVIL